MSPSFTPFDTHSPVRVYHRNLPHWRQVGATYFVTLRLADSIPATVLAEWLEDRTRWLAAHGIGADLVRSDPARFGELYARIPSGVRRAFEREQARMLHEELDRCHGSCLLKHAIPRRIVTEALLHFHGSRCWVGDFVVMPNHVHWLVQPLPDWELEDLLASVKKWTARRLGDPAEPSVRHTRSRRWQHESYDRIVRDAEELSRFRKYIAGNPAKARLADGQFGYHRAEWLPGQVA